MSLQLGRREQKKINNRKAILEAGLEVFSTIGYERATINDIVSASGLSVGTFYNHCGDKDTIFSELLTGFLLKVRTTLKEARQRATSLEGFVKGAFLVYGEFISQYPKMQLMISKNAPEFKRIIAEKEELTSIINDLAGDMQQAVESGLVPDFPVSMMTSAMIAASIDIFSMDNEAYSAQERAEFLGNLFVGGIEKMSASGQ
jgi:AcrR family transcriptional regulator